MKIDYQKAKCFLYKIIFSLDLLMICLNILAIEIPKNSLKEYTGVSHFFLNIYIFFIFIILLGHSIYPSFEPKIISKYFKFILSNKGKIIITFLISMIYRFSKSMPHYFLGIILFFSSLVLFVFEFIIYFKPGIEILKKKGIEIYNNKENINKKQNFTISKIETINEINISNSTRSEIEKL